MESVSTVNAFIVWGMDHVAYGPVELPTLVNWVRDERVTADTWVFRESDQGWHKASDVAELQLFFRPRIPSALTAQPKVGPGVSNETALCAVRPGSLRRIKIFADFKDPDLDRFVQFMEVLRVKQWTQIVKQGDFGDAMYLVLGGELRVRLMIDGKEKTLATLGIGEFFGEMSLFDHGPRSADVVANQDSLLLKISSGAFARLTREAPELASPFLLAVGRTLSARIRADNKRFQDSVVFAQAAG